MHTYIQKWQKQQDYFSSYSDSTLPVVEEDSDLSSVSDAPLMLRRENAMLPGTKLLETEVVEQPSICEMTIPTLSEHVTSSKQVDEVFEEQQHLVTNPYKRKILTLPKFSQHVTKMLKDGTAKYFLNRVVSECADHIIAQGDMKGKGGYAAFCGAMCERYPCLQNDRCGKNAHSEFSKILSHKMRNCRYASKKKGVDESENMATAASTIEDTSDLSIEEAYVKLNEEYRKADRSWERVLNLFRHVHADRRSQFLQLKSLRASEMLENFPLLSDIKLIREEFYIMVERSCQAMKTYYYQMIAALQIALDESQHSVDGSEADEINILLSLQRKLKNNRIKRKSSESAVTVMKAHDINLLANRRLSPPRLIIFQHENGDHQGWLLADGRHIQCSNDDGVFGMVIDLLACYYAWDLNYPLDFTLLLFIQEEVVGHVIASQTKNTKFNNVQKKFHDALANLSR